MAKRLLFLNGLAIIGVVLNHSTGWGYIALFWWTDRYRQVAVPNFEQFGSLNYYALRLIEQLLGFSVPAFIFVSGFFIAFTAARSPIKERWLVIRSRLTGLLIPYLVWSLIMMSYDHFVNGINYPVDKMVQTIITGEAAPAYYFIPVLIQLYIISPFLIAMVQRDWKLTLLITVIVQGLLQIFYYSTQLGASNLTIKSIFFYIPNWLFINRIFWFTLGIVICLRLRELASWFERNHRFILIATITFFVAGFFEWELLLRISGREWLGYFDTVVDSLYAVFLILSIVFFKIDLNNAVDWISSLGSKSYGVFLSHSLLLEIGARAIYRYAPFILAQQVLFQPVLWLIGLGGALMMIEAVRRTPLNPYYKYLFG
jgi:membrane-bound acyltransferase YfiQ involved in biofilm formation